MGQRLVQRVVGTLMQERVVLVADQAVSSLSNAAVLAVSGLVLSRQEFDQFSLIQFAAITCMTVLRALIAEPALAVRTGSAPPYPARWLVFAAFAALPFLLMWPQVGIRSSEPEHAFLFIALLLVPAQDLQRYRVLASGATRRLLLADSIWLLASVVGVAGTGLTDAEGVAVAWSLGAGLSLVVLSLGKGPPTSPVSLRQVTALGSRQALTVALTYGGVWLSIYVATWIDAEAPVGAYRLSSSLTGPILVINGAMFMHFLRAAPTLRGELNTLRFRSRLRRMTWQVFFGSIAYVALLVLLVALSPAPVDQLPLLVLLGVGAAAAIRSLGAPYLSVLRSIGEQTVILPIQSIIVALGIAAMLAFVPTDRGDAVLIAYVVASGLATAAIWPRVLTGTRRK